MKANKNPIVILCCCLALLLTGCLWVPETLTFKFVRFDNKSPMENFYVTLSLDYPDTSFHYEDWSWYDKCFLFHKGQDISFGFIPDYYFEKNKVLQLFLFYDDGQRDFADTAKWHKKWATQFLRRYEFTREWMEEHNWTITYP